MTESKGCSSKQGMEQSSTSKQAKNQRTLMTAIDIAERSILKHDQRKQQSLTAGSSIQVEGSVQIQHKKQDDRTGRYLFNRLSKSSSAQFQKDLVDHGSSKKQKTSSKCPSMSLDDYFKRHGQQLEVEGDINYENDDGGKTNDNPMEEIMKSKDDVYINSQFKRPMLPSSGEPLVDIPESIRWMFSKEYLSKHGIGQSSTLKQAKNQKTMVSTRDSAGRSILKHDQRKQRSTLKQAKIQKTTPSAINTAGRSIFEHDQRKQRSTLRQAKNQKTIMSTIDTAVRSILNHDQRKQQSLTAGSSIQVAGSAQMLHKKQDHMTAICPLSGGLSNNSPQFQNESVRHGPFKKQKTIPMCPAMSLDDYFKMYKQQLEVEGDINDENDDEFEGDINYENHDVEKTNDNPMEGNTPTS
ncbi:hypothetical protein P8452_30428 [Trifolium repens]|nr:hypothetical protein P8452_30428 [Trifolium repens]